MPSLAGVIPKRLSGEHSRRSHASATCDPPPIAKPSIIATPRSRVTSSSSTPASFQVGRDRADLATMVSVLGAFSVVAAGSAALVAGRWATRRRDQLGRPRAFPVWSVSLLALLAVAAMV